MMVSPLRIGDNHDRVLAVVNGICLRLSGFAVARAWNDVPNLVFNDLTIPDRETTDSMASPGIAMLS